MTSCARRRFIPHPPRGRRLCVRGHFHRRAAEPHHRDRPQAGERGHEYLYQGISARPFERRFSLADHVEVDGASYEHGLLQIDLVRRLPEAMKPRKIDIGNVATLPKRDKAKRSDSRTGRLITLILRTRWFAAISGRPPPQVTEDVMNDRNEREDRFDLDSLLHPAQAFGHPSEVVNDPDLTLNEKRAILASWASDACAIEAAPELRSAPKDRPSASTTLWMR